MFEIKRAHSFAIASTFAVLAGCGPGGGDGWKSKNAEVIAAQKLTLRERAIPPTGVDLRLDGGKVYDSMDVPLINLADGVTARVAWGSGALLEQLEMKPGAVYPELAMTGEVITVVEKGEATATVDGKAIELRKNSILYLTEGMKRTLKAGAAGFQALDVFSPVRADHLALAGGKIPGAEGGKFPDQGIQPSLTPAVAYNLEELQLTPLTPVQEGNSYKRHGASARLVWGRNAMLSLLRMDPGATFAHHTHPEEQLMIALRGALTQGVMDGKSPMDGVKRSINFLPSQMVHSAVMSEFGADAMDIFWPVRKDYIERQEKQLSLYREVIAPEARPVKLAEGFTFSEGPTWISGRLYFSDMFFKDPKNGDWTGSPAQSRTIVMEPGGKYRELAKGMQTNGTIASRTGNLLVCDMFGHRVIEVDKTTGKVLRTVLDKVNGKPIDGPNDLVMDAKGGIYVTDPQFTPEKEKNQPGKQVYYVAPDGAAKVVIPAGEYAMPNGIEVSPDGKTLYVNNTWFAPGENFLWAYDIQPDGSLTGKRKFAMLNLTPEVLSAAEPANRFDSRADGMAVDTDGRVYVATLSGAQVFDKTGTYVGTIWFPQYPVSCAFGGKNLDELYCVAESSAWKIQTRVKGFRHPGGLN
ncbi:MAG: SMP-30/gluconolactonase/LRE family protein [Acidobacteria bacterium]|nr:SMP-30/gluconolactonase/LRE family protein [Acidobacteriota bacterium]